MNINGTYAPVLAHWIFFSPSILAVQLSPPTLIKKKLLDNLIALWDSNGTKRKGVQTVWRRHLEHLGDPKPQSPLPVSQPHPRHHLGSHCQVWCPHSRSRCPEIAANILKPLSILLQPFRQLHEPGDREIKASQLVFQWLLHGESWEMSFYVFSCKKVFSRLFPMSAPSQIKHLWGKFRQAHTHITKIPS